jgi:hypothetical protein
LTPAATAPYSARMTEQPTHHHLVADTAQIKMEGPAVSMKVISPEELRAGAIVQPEPWMVRHLMDHPEAMRDLSGWEFQVYIAALIERKWGRKVELGPRGADDGVDVRAERQGEFGLELLPPATAKLPNTGESGSEEVVDDAGHSHEATACAVAAVRKGEG